MNSPLPSIGRARDLPPDWAQQVGSYWNYGHPWRQGNIWEDEVAQQTQGPRSGTTSRTGSSGTWAPPTRDSSSIAGSGGSRWCG